MALARASAPSTTLSGGPRTNSTLVKQWPIFKSWFIGLVEEDWCWWADLYSKVAGFSLSGDKASSFSRDLA